jgi:glycosyltransferase involved in cell wall biosynthesis/tetratricopeptide (TPR) repeat protein
MDPLPLPLASVIVRSMGRPELRLALESIARQDYPNVEVIVVDATGGSHPPLPAMAWPPGHSIRIVGGHRRLPRPQAANEGLQAVHGEWFCFLDDDDTYDTNHLSAMLGAAREHPQALLVYGRARMLDENGKVEKLFGGPFNRSLMYYGPLFYWQAAIIRRKVIELGCRFDEALEICEDRDFLNQIAEHSDFAFVPVMGFNYRPDLGTSGTGSGANRDMPRFARSDNLLRAKWAGATSFHTRRVARMCMGAVRAFHDGDLALSRALFEKALEAYPDDPSALHGLARLAFDDGQLATAEKLARRAIEVNPSAAEFNMTMALILEASHKYEAALAFARKAANHPIFLPDADALARRLPFPTPATPPFSQSSAAGVRRLAPCPCGSGRRFKDCCGAIRPINARELAMAKIVQHANVLFGRGEAFEAKNQLDAIVVSDLRDSEDARRAGAIYLELGEFERAFDFLGHASRLAPTNAKIGGMLEHSGRMLYARRRADSAYRTAYELRNRISLGADEQAAPQPIHLIATFSAIGGAESHAANLYRLLAPHTDIRLWSLREINRSQYPDLPISVLDETTGSHPIAGTLVVCGNYFDFGDWLHKTSIQRIIVQVNSDVPESLVERLTDIHESLRPVQVDFTFPSELFRQATGLPGEIEYPSPDTERFSPQPRTRRQQPFIIGRHSRDDATKHHPNDPALYRQLIRDGHRLRILGGLSLRAALRGSPDSAAIEVLPAGHTDPKDFLASIDCFFYRKHPNLFETGGYVVFEAMSMSLPVVVFDDRIGAAEIVEHGRNGFLVNTEAAALRHIDELAASPDLCERIGKAARQTVRDLIGKQNPRLLDYYLVRQRR